MEMQHRISQRFTLTYKKVNTGLITDIHDSENDVHVKILIGLVNLRPG